ncbi:MAG: PKD domain-containing protein, partial [Bacteroidota bacterium]
MKNYLILFIILFLASCKKNDDPVPVLEQPVFKVTGTVNGQPLNIQAGVNDYIMFTDYTFDNVSSVFEFNGSLRKYNCASCSNSLNVKIRNYAQTLSSQSILPDSTFTRNFYTIKSTSGNATQYSFTFESQLGAGAVQEYHWDFGDGATGNVDSLQHTYLHPGIYPVSLKVLYQNGCSDSLTNTFRIGVPGSVCRARFDPFIAGHTVTVSNMSVGVGALSYHWDFGDGTISTQENPQHIYAASGVYKITLTVTDCENHVSEFSRKVFTVPQSICIASYLYPNWVPESNTAALSNATIEWTDNNGILYSSENGAQSDNSFFKIISVEDYSNNSSGEKVKKLSVQFHSRLYNFSQTSYVDIDVNEAIIAVAY